MENELEQTPYNAYKVSNPVGVPLEMEKVMGEDNSSIIKFPDGSAVVEGGDTEGRYPSHINPDNHNENLALYLPENELHEIGSFLKNAIEEDIKSQDAYFKAVAKIIDNLGLISSSEGKQGLPFQGASNIYSSAVFETALDIVASAKKHIFPSANMVDTIVLGMASDMLQDIAYRKKEFFNYFFDNIAKEYRKESARTIFWATIAGSAYKKVYICPVLGRPVSNLIPIADCIVNREHSSHLASSRITHILRLDERDLQIRMMSGMYKDIDLSKQDEYDGEGGEVIREKLNNISGYDPAQYRDDQGRYIIYESHTDYRIKSDPAADQYKIPLPYIISFDQLTSKVLGIYRNWKRTDDFKKKKEYFVNYSFFPSLDGEGYGLAHSAGNLSEAATCITRQLINAGYYANFPGGVYQAGIRLENNNLRPAPGEFSPIQTAGLSISDAVMALPYKEPSPALHELKNEIEDDIKKPSAIVNQKISDMAPQAPQGSVLAMLDNLQRLPNALMQNFHESFTHELELFNDRFEEWLPEGQPYPFLVPGGDLVIMKQDFQADIQVRPASDPSRENSTNRFIRSEIVLNTVKQLPQAHNLKYALRYFYKNLELPEDEISKILTPEEPPQTPPPQPQDPVSTIMALTQSHPTIAAIWQDHDAYIAIIDNWIQTNPQHPNLQAAMALKYQHESYKYLVDVYSKLGMNPPEDPSQLNPNQQNELAVAVAQIKEQEAQEAAAKMGPPPEPPLDPAKVMLEDSQLKAQSAHEKHELENKRIELDFQKMQMEFALKEQEFNLKSQIQGLKQGIEEQKAQLEYIKFDQDQLLKERDQALKERDQALKENNELQHHTGFLPPA